MKSHPSALGCHSIFSIHKTVYQLATLLPISIEWGLRWTFRLRSNSRKMTPLAVRPIKRGRVSRNAVLDFSASVTVCNNEQGDMLTSQTTTVLGAHLTRTWKSWPRAMWSYRNFNRKSLSSCLYPMMWRVTVALCQLISRKGRFIYIVGLHKVLSRQ